MGIGSRLRRLVSGGESQSLERQLEVIITDLNDSPNRLFVWQFPGIDDDELEDIYSGQIEEIVTHQMQSEHIFTSHRVDIDEIVVDGENPIVARDNVYEYIREDE